MADFTAEQFKEAARKALAAGDGATAKKLIARAMALEPAKPQPTAPVVPAAPSTANPDGTYGEVPPGFVLNPKTGQMEDMNSLNNPNIRTGQGAAAAQSAGQGVSFGAMDEVVGGLYGLTGPGTVGQNYDYATARMREELDRGREQFPGTSLASEVGGALTVPVGGVAGSLPMRIVKSGAMTGALSGIYGFNAGEGNMAERAASAVPNAVAGGAIGLAIPGVGSLLQSALNSRAAKNAIAKAAKGAPSTDELRATGNALYQQVDDAGVQIAPQAFDRARGTILADLQANTGFDNLPGPGSLTPNTARVTHIMDEASGRMAAEPTAALPFKALDQMRRQAGAAAGNVTNKTDQQAGMTVIQGLDDFVNNLQPGDVVAGDIQALQDALPKAREVWSKMRKSQVIDDAIAAGEDYLSGASSGIRNQFKNILRNKKLAQGFSDAEKAAMRKVINGTIPEQLLQLAGGGLGQLGQVATGMLGGPVGAAIGAGSAALSRKAAEAVTTRKAEVVRALMANGGLAQLPVASTRPSAVTEALFRRGTAAASQPR